MKLAILEALNTERAARHACVLITDLGSGEQRLVKDAELERDILAEPIEAALRNGKSGMIEHENRQLFLTVQAPPVRLLSIGAVHISQVLAPMARVAGIDMTVVDPRTAFASPERFPDVPVIAEWPDKALPPIGLDRYTAIVLLTHDPKIDDPALKLALAAECFYIGALGSRKTHAARLDRMRAAGFDEARLARIHAPVGLDIGAVSPAEIAVAILGEMILARRKKPLRDAKQEGAAPALEKVA